MKPALALILSIPAWCAGPVLDTDQIQTAIQEGSKYKTADQFLEKGLKGKKVKLASAMALDSISKYATFYDDWQAIAAKAAAAHQQMRELKIDEAQPEGLLHVFVEVVGRGEIGSGKIDRRYQDQRAHLVLQIGDRIVQPTDQSMIKQTMQLTETILLEKARKITLNFAFDVSPEDLRRPVEVILIDGDGNKHRAKADLDGVLTLH
jgi:hypothetical protein